MPTTSDLREVLIRREMHAGDDEAVHEHLRARLAGPHQDRAASLPRASRRAPVRNWVVAGAVITAVAALIIGVAVLGPHPDHHAAAPGGPPTNRVTLPPVYVGAVKTETTLIANNLILDPPSGPAPRLTPYAAYRAWCQTATGTYECAYQPGAADILFGRVSTPATANHILSYVIIWHHGECLGVSGGATYTGGTAARSPSPPTPSVTCTWYFPVDANTGAGVAGQYSLGNG